jgi:hypothetical protein
MSKSKSDWQVAASPSTDQALIGCAMGFMSNLKIRSICEELGI